MDTLNVCGAMWYPDCPRPRAFLDVVADATTTGGGIGAGAHVADVELRFADGSALVDHLAAVDVAAREGDRQLEIAGDRDVAALFGTCFDPSPDMTRITATIHGPSPARSGGTGES